MRDLEEDSELKENDIVTSIQTKVNNDGEPVMFIIDCIPYLERQRLLSPREDDSNLMNINLNDYIQMFFRNKVSSKKVTVNADVQSIVKLFNSNKIIESIGICIMEKINDQKSLEIIKSVIDKKLINSSSLSFIIKTAFANENNLKKVNEYLGNDADSDNISCVNNIFEYFSSYDFIEQKMINNAVFAAKPEYFAILIRWLIKKDKFDRKLCEDIIEENMHLRSDEVIKLSLNYVNKFYLPLSKAIRHDRQNIIKLMLTYGVNYNEGNRVNYNVLDTYNIPRNAAIRFNRYKLVDLFDQLDKDQYEINNILKQGVFYFNDLTDDQKKALSNEISLTYVLARCFNPDAPKDLVAEDYKKSFLLLALENPYFSFAEILQINPHLIGFVYEYIKDKKDLGTSKVEEILYKVVNSLIRNNKDELEFTDKNKLDELKHLNEALQELKIKLEKLMNFEFKSNIFFHTKERKSDFSDIEIHTPNLKRTIDQIYKNHEEREGAEPKHKIMKSETTSRSRS